MREQIAVTIAAAMAVLITLPIDAGAAFDIGHATAITTNVSAAIDGQTATLATGDTVYENQEIVTDSNGIGEFIFRDDTRLAIGPGSTIVLDRFVYDSNGTVGQVAIGITRGALRFMTGTGPHDAYVITTPSATIGVRGTAFDVYADGTGELAIAMINGEVEVCPRLGRCRQHSLVGNFLHLTRDGIFSLHDSWDGTFLRGVTFAAALPFMAAQDVLSPSLRAGATIARRYADTAGGTIRDAGGTAVDAVRDAGGKVRDKIDDIPRPRVRIRNPFR